MPGKARQGQEEFSVFEIVGANVEWSWQAQVAPGRTGQDRAGQAWLGRAGQSWAGPGQNIAKPGHGHWPGQARVRPDQARPVQDQARQELCKARVGQASLKVLDPSIWDCSFAFCQGLVPRLLSGTGPSPIARDWSLAYYQGLVPRLLPGTGPLPTAKDWSLPKCKGPLLAHSDRLDEELQKYGERNNFS